MSDSSATTLPGAAGIDVRRTVFLLLGLGLFCLVYFCPPWPDAVDPSGNRFVLSHQGKAALGLFLLAATWWVTEVVPIGITSIAIGTVQALFLIRPDKVIPDEVIHVLWLDVVVQKGEVISGSWISFTDFLAPSVWFIFGSLTIGAAFTQTGLTKRLAYKMLTIVGERTSMIMLGCFVMTGAMTLIMAHTAVAATIYPLLATIYAMYSDDPSRPSKFGKALFMGMAYVAGAGSIITLLGAARGAVAIGFFREIEGSTIGFFELSYYMLPLGVAMIVLLWVFFMIWYKPEKKTIPGLRERAKELNADLGRITTKEVLTLVIVGSAIAVLACRSFIPAFKSLDKAAVILTATILFFVFKILRLRDLENTSWNIVLLFGGAMSIGYCLWQTGAAKWMAINWLVMFEGLHWGIFVLGIAFFVLIMTNFIMNVAAIAISMPVALEMSRYMGVSGEVILFASLVAAGMPFLLLVGAAPNAIAYASKQFTSREFFTTGVPASLMLMVVIALFVFGIWPIMGMPMTR